MEAACRSETVSRGWMKHSLAAWATWSRACEVAERENVLCENLTWCLMENGRLVAVETYAFNDKVAKARRKSSGGDHGTDGYGC